MLPNNKGGRDVKILRPLFLLCRLPKHISIDDYIRFLLLSEIIL